MRLNSGVTRHLWPGSPLAGFLLGILLAAPLLECGSTRAQLTRTHASGAASRPNRAAIERRVDDLLKEMSTEEKIGQLSQEFFFRPNSSLDDKIRKGELGSVLFTTDPEQINRMQRIAVNESPHHIPLIFGFDVVHGLAVVFPVPIGMAASWDPQLEENAQRIAADEARTVGVDWTFAPMVDIARDARWGRIVEGAGEDPFLGSAMAAAQVRGFQGEYIGEPDRVIACVKHFAGYGAAEGGRDYDASYIPEDEMWNVYLPPFQAALDAGAGTVMSAYMDLNDVPATGNRWLLHDVLRVKWGFEGFVVSDADAVKSLVTHGFARDSEDAAERAFDAGVNMEMAIGNSAYSTGLIAASRDDKIDPLALNTAVRPILKAKIEMGLFEHPYVDESQVDRLLQNPAHLGAARLAAERSAVLLRNQDGLLPMRARAFKHIAVIGPFAESREGLLGPWSLAADPSTVQTLGEALRKMLGAEISVVSAPGVQPSRLFPSPMGGLGKARKDPKWSDAEANQQFDEAVEAARNADVVIAALGELPDMSGESASVSSLELPGRQEELLEAAVATGKPVILVLFNGRPLDIRWAFEHVSAILEAWFPGSGGGAAIANLLFGNATPGGKLPFTWPRDAAQLPLYYSHNTTQAPQNQGKRYWNETSTPLLPFGYGLSYAKFAFSNLMIDKTEIKRGETIKVSADIEDLSDVPGDEVAQLYIHQRWGSASRPVRELKGFERIALKPHQKKTVEFSLGKDELSYWAASESGWIQDASEFDVWVGGDSDTSLHGTFTVAR